MAHPDAWYFSAKPQKPKPQTKETPQGATKPQPEPAPVITDYASI